MSTAHINAEIGDFAPTVLMPGDPRRAERIANQLFDEPRLVTDVRGMLGFTGEYRGRKLSVMGSGMGQPSISIYATELFQFFGVERIIRIGTCGGMSPQVKVGDTVIALSAHTDSGVNRHRFATAYYAPTASFPLVLAAYEACPDRSRLHVGPIFSSDSFYRSWEGPAKSLADYGTLGVEMESGALYTIAAEFGKEALTVLTVSDHIFNGGADDMTSEQREVLYQDALDMAVAAAFV